MTKRNVPEVEVNGKGKQNRVTKANYSNARVCLNPLLEEERGKRSYIYETGYFPRRDGKVSGPYIYVRTYLFGWRKEKGGYGSRS